jgi:MoaA/NifB/PqqE/SkfB family radical SAM enzyme
MSAHEKIRRKEGSWDKAIHTARTLQQMKREQYPQLDIQTCTCVMHSNEDTIFDWYDFLKHDLKPDKVNINYIRPPSADPIELEFDHRRYQELSQMILDDTKNAALKNNYGGKSGFFKAAVDIYMHDIIAKTKEEQKAQLKCYAGSAGAVIYDNGALSSCENKPDVLNLRDYNWDFQAAWKTKLMQERRVEAGAGCYCTHESNCFYPSLPFNAKHLINIKKLEGQMKKASKEMTLRQQPENMAVKA